MLAGYDGHRSVPHRNRFPTCPASRLPVADGPDIYKAGTLFPRSSKKIARALNAASGTRPAVVLANLSGFDGSPESTRTLQLEYRAKIGRAIVDFEGPIVVCAIFRSHGGVFVVFSEVLNPNMSVLAIEGAYVSVIGGALTAAVVSGDDARTAEISAVSSGHCSWSQRSWSKVCTSQSAATAVWVRLCGDPDDHHRCVPALFVAGVARCGRKAYPSRDNATLS